MYCGEATLVNPAIGSGRAVTLFCKCWACQHCVAGCRRRLRGLFLAGEPDMFITLTWDTKLPGNPAQAARVMVRGWRKLRRRIARHLGIEPPPFYLVIEQTRKGYPHVHILLRMPFLWRGWLKRNWREITGSYIVDIRRLHSQRHAASYLSKYLAKVRQRFDGCNRHWGSQDYALDAPDNPPDVTARTPGWKVYKRNLRAFRDELETLQYLTHPDGDTLTWCWGWPSAPPDGRLGFDVPP